MRPKASAARAQVPLSDLYASWGILYGVDEYPGAVPGRKFRLDVAWPKFKVCVEQQGGIWSYGKHGRGSGIIKDMERQNLLAIEGWIVLQFTPSQIWDGRSTDIVKTALKSRGWNGE